MDFSLETLAEAFQSIKYQAGLDAFPSFAFVLATGADNGLFPALLTHFPELHYLTSSFMLVVAPRISMNKAKNVRMNAEEIENVLSSGVFYDHYGGLKHDKKGEIQKFTERQTLESINFARFCGISVDELPCIVFFSSLADPNAYVKWKIKDQTSNSVVGDFRRIIARMEREFSELTELHAQSRFLTDERQRLLIGAAKLRREKQKKENDIPSEQEALKRKIARLNSLEADPSNIPGFYIKKAKAYEADSELANAIEETQHDLIGAFREFSLTEPNALSAERFNEKLGLLALKPFQADTVKFVMGNLRSNPTLISKFTGYVELVQSQDEVISETEQRIDKERALAKLRLDIGRRRERIDHILLEIPDNSEELLHTKEIKTLDVELSQLKIQMRDLVKPDILQIIQSLDRRRFVYQALRDLGRAVPIVNGGVSLVTGVWAP